MPSSCPPPHPDEGLPPKKKRLSYSTALTFYLRLHGVGHVVKDHSDSKRGNLLPPHGLFFPISSNDFIHHHIDRIVHTTPFVIVSWITDWNDKYLNGSTMKDRSNEPSHHERTLLSRNYISLPPVHGVKNAVDKGHWNRGPYAEKRYTQMCCSYRPWSHFVKVLFFLCVFFFFLGGGGGSRPTSALLDSNPH